MEITTVYVHLSHNTKKPPTFYKSSWEKYQIKLNYFSIMPLNFPKICFLLQSYKCAQVVITLNWRLWFWAWSWLRAEFNLRIFCVKYTACQYGNCRTKIMSLGLGLSAEVGYCVQTRTEEAQWAYQSQSAKMQDYPLILPKSTLDVVLQLLWLYRTLLSSVKYIFRERL